MADKTQGELKNGESCIIKEGKWWKFVSKASDGSSFYYSAGVETRAEAEQLMKEHDTKTGRYAWRMYD